MRDHAASRALMSTSGSSDPGAKACSLMASDPSAMARRRWLRPRRRGDAARPVNRPSRAPSRSAAWRRAAPSRRRSGRSRGENSSRPLVGSTRLNPRASASSPTTSIIAERTSLSAAAAATWSSWRRRSCAIRCTAGDLALERLAPLRERLGRQDAALARQLLVDLVQPLLLAWRSRPGRACADFRPGRGSHRAALASRRMRW